MQHVKEIICITLKNFTRKAGLVDNQFYKNDFLLFDCPHTRLSTLAGLPNKRVKKRWELLHKCTKIKLGSHMTR